MKEKSEIDELFFRLMGYYPTKAGQAFEMISAAALGIVRSQMAEHNTFLKGESGGRQRMISVIGLPTSGIASIHPCSRR